MTPEEQKAFDEFNMLPLQFYRPKIRFTELKAAFSVNQQTGEVWKKIDLTCSIPEDCTPLEAYNKTLEQLAILHSQPTPNLMPTMQVDKKGDSVPKDLAFEALKSKVFAAATKEDAQEIIDSAGTYSTPLAFQTKSIINQKPNK